MAKGTGVMFVGATVHVDFIYDIGLGNAVKRIEAGETVKIELKEVSHDGR